MTGNGIVKLPWKRDSLKFKQKVRDVFACMYAVNSGNHTFELQMRINQVLVEFCHLSNQTIKCALFVRVIFVYGNKRGIREGDMEKNSGMPDFL